MDGSYPEYTASTGNYRTYSLFIEYPRHAPELKHPFTLGPRHTKEEYSMRECILKCEDPTGYLFAIEYLGSWEHFQVLLASKTFGPKIQRWLEEVEAAILAESIRGLRNIVKKDGPGAAAASRWLATQGWKKKGKGGGRPSNKTKDDLIVDRSEDDMKRLGLGE